MKENLKLTVIYYPQVNGGYTAVCPEVGLTTQGEDMQQAEEMLKELIDDYFQNDNTMDFEDYIEGYNTGHKIITELDYEPTRTDC